MYFVAKIEILIAANDQNEACDAISETMRPLLRTFNSESCIIDWRYSGNASVPTPHSGEGFEYAEEK